MSDKPFGPNGLTLEEIRKIWNHTGQFKTEKINGMNVITDPDFTMYDLADNIRANAAWEHLGFDTELVPDPEFYYTEEKRQDAIERYKRGEVVKMVQRPKRKE